MTSPVRHAPSLPASPLLVSALALVLAACASAPPVLPPPDDLPAIEAQWAPLLRQVPATASAVYLVALDERTRTGLADSLSALDSYEDLSTQLADAIGVDLASAQAFDQLGLRLGGGLVVYLDGSALVAVADLADASAARELIDGFVARNPDLATAWREGESGDVFSVDLPAPGGVGTDGPRAHVAIEGDQLAAVLDFGAVPSPEGADERLAAIFGRTITEPVYLNPRFQEAARTFGGGTWVLGYADIAALVGRVEQLMGVTTSDPACRALRAETLASLQALTFAVEHGPAEGLADVEEVVSRTHLHLSADAATDAEAMLRPAPLDLAAFRSGAIASGVLSVDLPAALALLGDPQAPEACTGLTALVAMLRRGAAEMTGQTQDLSPLSGVFGGALFDLRSNAGLTFADLFLVAGSSDPVALTSLIQSAIEETTGAQGSVETVEGLAAMRYRVALVYQLTLYRGAAAVGMSLGRVPQDWLTPAMDLGAGQSEVFLDVALDGARALEALDMLIDTVTALADEETAEAQRAAFDEIRRDLVGLVAASFQGRLASNRVEIVGRELRSE